MRSRTLPRLGTVALFAAATLLLSAHQARAATIVVNTTADGFENGGTCSLREAVRTANDNLTGEGLGCNGDAAGADTIVLQAGATYVLTRHAAGDDHNTQDGDLDILGGGGTTIRSSGSALATIDADSATVPGSDTLRNRAIDVRPSAGAVTLERLRIRAGVVTDGTDGGGVRSFAPLTILDSEVTGNAIILNANGGGAGIGIRDPGSLTLTRSTVSNNSITANPALPGDSARGGGIVFSSGSGDFVATNSTISGNTVNSSGNTVNATYAGGIYWLGGLGGRTMTLTNLTISNNTATANGGSTLPVYGGGIVLFESNAAVSRTTLTNTILAGNVAPSQIDCGVVDATDDWISGGNNVIGDSECDAIGGVNDIFFANPALGNLSDYGGPTRTQILNPGSPAINRGGTCPATDQRGFFRAPVAPCDAGALELNAPATLPQPPPAGPTGQRAAALKKCKRKRSKKARKKCRAKAALLPV